MKCSQLETFLLKRINKEDILKNYKVVEIQPYIGYDESIECWKVTVKRGYNVEEFNRLYGK